MNAEQFARTVDQRRSYQKGRKFLSSPLCNDVRSPLQPRPVCRGCMLSGMRDMQRTIWKRAAAGLVLSVGLVGFLSGCSKPLLSPTDIRSQYDRYDRARNQYASQYIEDEFGQRQPNLRARLAPKH